MSPTILQKFGVKVFSVFSAKRVVKSAFFCESFRVVHLKFTPKTVWKTENFTENVDTAGGRRWSFTECWARPGLEPGPSWCHPGPEPFFTSLSVMSLFLGHFSAYGLPNLWFACGSPFTKTTEITQATNFKTTKTTQTATNKVESWICGNYGNHGSDENYKNPGCKQKTLEIKGFSGSGAPFFGFGLAGPAPKG